jgi:hypothetical protein
MSDQIIINGNYTLFGYITSSFIPHTTSNIRTGKCGMLITRGPLPLSSENITHPILGSVTLGVGLEVAIRT